MYGVINGCRYIPTDAVDVVLVLFESDDARVGGGGAGDFGFSKEDRRWGGRGAPVLLLGFGFSSDDLRCGAGGAILFGASGAVSVGLSASASASAGLEGSGLSSEAVGRV